MPRWHWSTDTPWDFLTGTDNQVPANRPPSQLRVQHRTAENSDFPEGIPFMKCRWDKILLTGISKGPLSLWLNSLIFFPVCNLNRKLLLAPGCPFFLEDALKSLAELFWEWACVEIHPLGGTKNPENLHLTSFFSLIHTLFSTSVLYWSSCLCLHLPEPFPSIISFPGLICIWRLYQGR